MKDFLDKYDTVIFDMDGVITSEQNYWNCAALTVREYLAGEEHFGRERLDGAAMTADVRRIRSEVFEDDAIIDALKSRGVNSNWDLGYVTVLMALAVDSDNGCTLLEYAKGLGDNILDEYENLAHSAAVALGCDESFTERGGDLWRDMRDSFQEWFLGDAEFTRQYGRTPYLSGKPGLVYSEQPIIPMDKLKRLLRELSEGKRVCTGTGRPSAELMTPLRQWDALKYFTQNGLCSYDHVAAAEKASGLTLTKPHPYMFLKALYGTDYPDERLLRGDYDPSAIARVLIVGDAGADIIAAKAMNADFCAVLTGIKGKAAREYFEQARAEYILDSAADLL